MGSRCQPTNIPVFPSFLGSVLLTAPSCANKHVWYIYIIPTMQNIFLEASPSDCWLTNRRPCIIQRDHRHLRTPFRGVVFTPAPSATSSCSVKRVWRVNTSCHPSLSKHVKGSLMWLLALFAPACLSLCASRCFLDFRRGLLTWNQRERQVNFFWEEKKRKKSCLLLLFLVPAESIKPAHQLGNADSYRPWIIKRSPWTRSGDGGQQRGPSHLSTTAAFVKA